MTRLVVERKPTPAAPETSSPRRRVLAGDELRKGATAYLKGLDSDAVQHARTFIALLEGHAGGLP